MFFGEGRLLDFYLFNFVDFSVRLISSGKPREVAGQTGARGGASSRLRFFSTNGWILFLAKADGFMLFLALC